MKQYNELLQHVLEYGIPQSDRTGVGTRFIPGAMVKYDLRNGFPAVTTKTLAFKSVIGELIGFLRGYDNAAKFRELNCRIWDQNANENEAWLNNPHRKGQDDLGEIYGVMWSKWPTVDGGHYNQLSAVLDALYNNPNDRRIMISGWRPDRFDRMALPPCHVLYHFIPDTINNELHLVMYQRSADMFLGVPFNIASCAAMLTIMSKLTGFTPATFTHMLGNAHIYNNHIEQVLEQLSREPRELPTLVYTGPTYDGVNKFSVDVFNSIKPEHFKLDNYNPHPAIKAPMAV